MAEQKPGNLGDAPQKKPTDGLHPLLEAMHSTATVLGST